MSISRRKAKMSGQSDILRGLLEERERAYDTFNEVTEESLVDAAVYELASLDARINKVLAEIRAA